MNKLANLYNTVANRYSEQFMGELAHKSLDRLLPNAFYNENKDKGPIADLGCGPGQIAQYLASLGSTPIIGVDLSEAMV